MMNSLIAYYSTNPPNKHPLPHPTIRYTEPNKDCTDNVEVFINIDRSGIITDWSFTGDTSIITTAAASLFWQSIIGKHIDEILTLKYSYIASLLQQELSPRRKQSAAYVLLVTKNAIHTYLQDGKKESLFDVLWEE